MRSPRTSKPIKGSRATPWWRCRRLSACSGVAGSGTASLDATGSGAVGNEKGSVVGMKMGRERKKNVKKERKWKKKEKRKRKNEREGYEWATK